MRRHKVTAESAWMVPLVCMCGHANHGKTSLLSALGGGARVWLKDSKGITQVFRTFSQCRAPSLRRLTLRTC
jgi:translation elongation factor EF-Tu-like GTPase